MKNLILLFFLPILCFGQEYNYDELYLPLTEGTIKYSEVVDAPGKTKAELFQNSKVWFVNNFRSADDVINFQDEASGIIAGRANTSIYIQSMGQTVERRIFFSVKIESRDERFKYTIEQIEMSAGMLERRPIEVEFSREYMIAKNGKPRKASWEWYEQYERKIIALEEMLKKEIPKKSDDW